MTCLLRALIKKMTIEKYRMMRRFQTSDGKLFKVVIQSSENYIHYYINDTGYFTILKTGDETPYFVVNNTYTIKYKLNTFLIYENCDDEWTEIDYKLTPEEYFQYEIIHKKLPSFEYIKYISSIARDVMKYNCKIFFDDDAALKELLTPYDHITLLKENY